MEALRVAGLIISGVYAGAVVMYMVVLPPLFAVLPGEHAVRVKRRIDPLNDRFWPPFIVAAIVATVLLLFLDRVSPAVTVLTAVGLVGLIAVPVTTRGIVIPINRKIHALDTEAAGEAERGAVDEAFRGLHRQWAARHAVRLGFALTAFVSFAVALALV